jgi:hypothetical protein
VITLSCSLFTKETYLPNNNNKNTTLCIYAIYEKNEEYRDNVLAFLYGGGMLPHVDYVLVVNGPFEFPKEDFPNTRIIRRANQGYDFGAWAHALRELGDSRIYSNFIFLNSSVRGPFTQRYGPDWTKPLLEKLNGNVRLVGLTINVLPVSTFPGSGVINEMYGRSSSSCVPHVQSMLFAVDAGSLQMLRAQGIFDDVPDGILFHVLILEREVRMSTAILAKGWNIDCMASRYTGLDYVNIDKDPNPSSRDGDPFYPGAYWHETLDPSEIMFYKTERITYRVPVNP